MAAIIPATEVINPATAVTITEIGSPDACVVCVGTGGELDIRGCADSSSFLAVVSGLAGRPPTGAGAAGVVVGACGGDIGTGVCGGVDPDGSSSGDTPPPGCDPSPGPDSSGSGGGCAARGGSTAGGDAAAGGGCAAGAGAGPVLVLSCSRNPRCRSWPRPRGSRRSGCLGGRDRGHRKCRNRFANAAHTQVSRYRQER